MEISNKVSLITGGAPPVISDTLFEISIFSPCDLLLKLRDITR